MTVKWISGLDPLHHKMYVAFGYHRTTAKLRKETWHLTWPQWRDAWLPVWNQRGRGRDCLCMARIHMMGDWCLNNIEIITRQEHGRRVREFYA